MTAAVTTEGPVSSRQLGAILFLASANITFQAYGTLNSSPWTTENVGADAEKVRSMREYVTHAVIASGAAAVVSAVMAESYAPIAAAILANAYLVWVYNRAAERGNRAGSDGRGWFDTWGRRTTR